MTISAETISLTIGISSFIAAIIFFFSARKSEIHTIELLAKIKNQTNTLERINDNLLSTAIQHLASSNTKLIDIAIPSIGKSNEQLLSDKNPDDLTNLIAIYFYTSRSYFFATLYKHHVPLSNETKSTHVIADNVISLSKDDFIQIKHSINKHENLSLSNHHLYQTYLEVEKYWTPIIIPENP